MALEVAHQAVHAQAGEQSAELHRRGLDHRLGDVHRHVALEGARAGHRVEQRARLRGRPRAELHQLPRAGELDDRRRVAVEDRPLAPRRVVLGLLGDSVEELGPAVVVEVLRRQLLRRALEAGADVGGHRVERALLQEGVDLDVRAGEGRHLRRAAEADEDLAALRQVPRPEGGPHGVRAGGPRSAAQHTVAPAEVGLRVLAVGERAEPRVAAELARGPLPRVADQPEHAVRRRSPGSPPAAAGPIGRWSSVARSGVGRSSPHGHLRFAPARGSQVAVFSHSASLGSRFPRERA